MMGLRIRKLRALGLTESQARALAVLIWGGDA